MEGSEFHGGGGNKESRLGHDDGNTDGADETGFSDHVGSIEKHAVSLVGVKLDVMGNIETLSLQLFNDRMSYSRKSKNR